MKILFAASEAAPFIKTGGLGDVAGALPKALAALGHDVRVIIPYYGDIPESFRCTMNYLGNTTVTLAWRNLYCGVFTQTVGGVKYYFVDNEYYFKRKGVYGHYDDAERFAFFAKAVLESLPIMDFYPEVIHANDWQTALVPTFLDSFYRGREGYRSIRTVFTIHNIEFQGKYGCEIIQDILGLAPDKVSLIDYAGCVNYMKSAIESSSAVTTVSRTYANEILHPFFSYGLEDILQNRRFKIRGVLNGIDTDVFDPETDKALFENYSAKTPEKKKDNKKGVLNLLGLKYDEQKPLVAMITRLTAQKGIDLVMNVLDDILSRNLQLIVLGTGDWKYETQLKEFEKRYPNDLRVIIGFSTDLANKLYAASDLFLMPSKFEPCGLSQLVAMRYGSIPIVRETGGLKDTVIPFDETTETGLGYTFYSYNALDMLGAIDRALDCYSKPQKFAKLVKNAMKADYGWSQSAKLYLEIYEETASI